MSNDESRIPWEQRVTVRPREVADHTGVPLTTIYDAIRAGKLRATKVSAKVWVIRVADVEDWLRGREPRG